MDALVRKIQFGIDDKKFCSIFRNDAEENFGLKIEVDRASRERIETFAKAHGWEAHFSEPTLRVTFKPLPEPPLAW